MAIVKKSDLLMVASMVLVANGYRDGFRSVLHHFTESYSISNRSGTDTYTVEPFSTTAEGMKQFHAIECWLYVNQNRLWMRIAENELKTPDMVYCQSHKQDGLYRRRVDKVKMCLMKLDLGNINHIV